MTNSWKKFWSNKKLSLVERFIFFIRKTFVSKKMANFCLSNTNKGKILEAGSGAGISSILVSKSRGDEIVLCDLEEEPLSMARAIADEYGINLRTIICDIQYMNLFKDNEFDLVWNIGTIEHFIEPLPIILEMKRCGKKVIAIVPEISFFWSFFLSFSRLMNRIDEDFYIYLYKKEELLKLFSRKDFKNITISRIRVFFVIPYLAVVSE